MNGKTKSAFHPLPYLSVFCLALILTPSWSWPPIQEVPKASEQITVHFEGVSLTRALRMIAEKLNQNLIFDSGIEDKTLKVYLENVHPMDAFIGILEANDLWYKELRGSILYVSRAEKLGSQAVVKNLKCRYAKADELKPILEQLVVSKNGSVMADKRTNTLVVKERPAIIARMEQLVEELDQPIKQVYIQAEIVEVSSTDKVELGVEWLWTPPSTGSAEGQIGTDFGLQTPQQSSRTGEPPAPQFPFPTGNGLGIGILNTNLKAVLHALSEVTNVNLLSRPRVVTMDNQESVIEVGDQIPYKVLNEFGITSFEFKDATIQLVVKPHIVDSDYIMLEVAPKADFQNGVTSDGTPIIATRKATTNVKVRNGQTIVIGGLIRDAITVSQQKVPFLGSIPLIGHLFRSKKTTKIKTELLVFITPVILEDSEPKGLFKKDFELRHKLEKKLD